MIFYNKYALFHFCFACLFLENALFSDSKKELHEVEQFINQYCLECHDSDVQKGGLNLEELGYNFDDKAVYSKWEQLFDRVAFHEMPPEKKKKQPSSEERKLFGESLAPQLIKTHDEFKGTVLRRLNREEYQNTLNDIFGTNLDIAEMLPEDGRSHEFDNVGESLNMSMVQLRRYIDVATKVLNTSIANRPEPLKEKNIQANYNIKANEKHIGKKWKRLEDGTVVRFHGQYYPSGILQKTNVKESGFYDIEIKGFAYQSEKAINFSVKTTSYSQGSTTQVLGFFALPPGESTVLKFRAYIKNGYMLKLEPFGLNYHGPYLKNKEKFNPETYLGPGFAIQDVKLTGPKYPEYPLKGHQLVFEGIDRKAIVPTKASHLDNPRYIYKFDVHTDQPRVDAEISLKRVATKLFRRDNPDIKPYLQLFDSEIEKGESFEEALKTATISILCSPDFLYFNETKGHLDNFAIANRLSYFLTRTSPDDVLMELARKGQLLNTKVREQQLKRLIKKPEFNRFVKDFTDAWLNLRDLDFTEPDKTLFPEYAGYLRYSMPLETRAFFKEMILSNLSVSNVITSDFVMVNDRLAELYKMDNVIGPKIRKVKLQPNSVRGGFLSQASIHKVSANGTNTSPVVRGIYVLERVLGITPPPPPAGVPAVEPDIRGAETLREILKKHRDSTNCNACHQKIDPLGFALESFSPIGVFREHFRAKKGTGKRITPRAHGSHASYYKELKVDASGELKGGRKFNTFNEFRSHLLQDKKLIAKTLAKKLLTFATGRDIGFSDRKEIDRIVSNTESKGYRMIDLMKEIIHSKIFLTK